MKLYITVEDKSIPLSARANLYVQEKDAGSRPAWWPIPKWQPHMLKYRTEQLQAIWKLFSHCLNRGRPFSLYRGSGLLAGLSFRVSEWQKTEKLLLINCFYRMLDVASSFAEVAVGMLLWRR